MDKRLNYRKLLAQWMQFYTLPAELSKKMFASIWMRLQALIENPGEEGADKHESHME